jgi:hypothetical protein
MSDTRQLRWVVSRWKEMSGDWQMEEAQPSWDLTENQMHTLEGVQKSMTRVGLTVDLVKNQLVLCPRGMFTNK